jgi:hypothetical protein
MAEQGRAVGILPRAESSPAEDRGEVVALIEQLEQAGWSIGDVALRGASGGLVWIVLGRCGSDLLMVSGATRPEAWWRALDRAAAVGMLPGRPRPARGEGIGDPAGQVRNNPADRRSPTRHALGKGCGLDPDDE